MSPEYVYVCKKCQAKKNVFQKTFRGKPPECCGRKMAKEISTGHFILRGQGFHKNDYPKGK